MQLRGSTAQRSMFSECAAAHVVQNASVGGASHARHVYVTLKCSGRATSSLLSNTRRLEGANTVTGATSVVFMTSIPAGVRGGGVMRAHGGYDLDYVRDVELKRGRIRNRAAKQTEVMHSSAWHKCIFILYAIPG